MAPMLGRNWRKFIAVAGIVLATFMMGLRFGPVFGLGPPGVLLQLATSPQTTFSVALVVIGVIVLIVGQVLASRCSASVVKTSLDNTQGPVRENTFQKGAVLLFAETLTIAATLCIVAGMALVAVRAVALAGPVIRHENFDQQLKALKEAIPHTCGTSLQVSDPPWTTRQTLAADGMVAFLRANGKDVTEEDRARGWTAAGIQYVILCDYPHADEALQQVRALPQRFQPEAEGLHRYYYDVRLARDGVVFDPDPPKPHPDERLETVRTMEQAFHRNEHQRVRDAATEYIRRYESDSNDHTNAKHLILLGSAHAWLANVLDISTPAGQIALHDHCGRGRELASIARSVIGVDAFCREDADRIDQQCAIALDRLVALSREPLTNSPAGL